MVRPITLEQDYAFREGWGRAPVTRRRGSKPGKMAIQENSERAPIEPPATVAAAAAALGRRAERRRAALLSRRGDAPRRTDCLRSPPGGEPARHRPHRDARLRAPGKRLAGRRQTRPRLASPGLPPPTIGGMDDAINGQPRAGAFAMRVLPVIFFSFFATAAVAGEATPAATPATAVASDGASQPQLKAVGRLNVNTATRHELSAVPGLDPTAIQAILEARTTARIADLARITPLSPPKRACTSRPKAPRTSTGSCSSRSSASTRSPPPPSPAPLTTP